VAVAAVSVGELPQPGRPARENSDNKIKQVGAYARMIESWISGGGTQAADRLACGYRKQPHSLA
jgi:hypothetical protein